MEQPIGGSGVLLGPNSSIHRDSIHKVPGQSGFRSKCPYSSQALEIVALAVWFAKFPISSSV